MFTLRRLVYALAIVFLASHSLFGVWVVLFGTLVMLVYALTEAPWRDPLISNQHLFNEVVTYLVCIFLLVFNNYVSAATRNYLGYTLICIISIFLVYNGVIMMRRVCRLGLLLLEKWRIRRRHERLRSEARAVSIKIKKTLGDLIKPPKLFESDSDNCLCDPLEEDDEQVVFKVELRQVGTLGIQGEIQKDLKAMARLKQPCYDSDSKELRDLYNGRINWQLSQIKTDGFIPLAKEEDNRRSLQANAMTIRVEERESEGEHETSLIDTGSKLLGRPWSQQKILLESNPAFSHDQLIRPSSRVGDEALPGHH